MLFIRCFRRSIGKILISFRSTRLIVHYFWYGLGQTLKESLNTLKLIFTESCFSRRTCSSSKRAKRVLHPCLSELHYADINLGLQHLHTYLWWECFVLNVAMKISHVLFPFCPFVIMMRIICLTLPSVWYGYLCTHVSGLSVSVRGGF